MVGNDNSTAMNTKTILTITALSIGALGFGQTSTSELTNKENVTTNVANADNLKIRFESHREISEYKASLLEDRFKITFPDLQSINIDPSTQTIELELPRFNAQVTITRILTYFNTSNYETL